MGMVNLLLVRHLCKILINLPIEIRTVKDLEAQFYKTGGTIIISEVIIMFPIDLIKDTCILFQDKIPNNILEYLCTLHNTY